MGAEASASESKAQRALELVERNAAESGRFFGSAASAAIELPVREHSAAMTQRLATLYNDLFRGAHERVKADGGIPTSVAKKSNGSTEEAPSEDAVVAAKPHNSTLAEGILERVEQAPNGLTGSHGGSLALRTVVAADSTSKTLARRRTGGMRTPVTLSEKLAADRPTWHAPWRMYRAISGHMGWVRCVAVDSTNEWFASGSADRTIKIWGLGTGKLRLTLTGHVSAVRSLAVSARHPYLFSGGEDKSVKCWDLEYNKVVRAYHGHLSGVYSVALHPTLDVLFSGGRDSAVRVWDMRTRAQVMTLAGHKDGINGIVAQRYDPQVISASVDSTVRLWDLAAGKCASVLTNHKRGVRALALHPGEFSFATASIDAVKSWALPHGVFMRNLRAEDDGNKELPNCMAINADGVLMQGGNDGSMSFWDVPSAHRFQHTKTVVQPGSLDCEAGVLAAAYDMSGSRIITAEMDKTIKMWKEDTTATPETHPLDWKPDMRPKRY